uniref:Reelin domain-containing protein n=1 Tax=Lates calcarifer TaxID=8187 RepID=A0A4W6DIW9_LATCA
MDYGTKILYFKMWMWILIGLNFITKVYGYPNGNVAESCQSILPVHRGRTGRPIPPQTSNPPYEIHFTLGENGEPSSVTLRGKPSKFRGFLLEARETHALDEGPPVGKFIILNPGNSHLLTCSEQAGSAVSHSNDARKTSVQFNWTALGAEQNITFRATVVETYDFYWVRVDKSVSLPAQPTTASTEPSTTSATESHTTKPTIATNTKNTAVILISVDSFLEILKMELLNIVTALNSHFSLPLSKVTLGALVCVIIVINFTELVMVSLSFGSSPEVKEICNHVVKVCAVVHEIFTIAVIFVGILEIDCRLNRTESWLLKVVIAYTAWIFLFEVWVFIFSIYSKIILRRSKIENSKSSGQQGGQQGQKKNLDAAKVTVIAISGIIIVGTMSFNIAIIVGISKLQEK